MNNGLKKSFFGLGTKYILIVFISVFLVGITLLAYTYFSLEELSSGIKGELIQNKSSAEEKPLLDALKERINSEAQPYLKPVMLNPAEELLKTLRDDFSKSKNFSYFLIRDRNQKINENLSFSLASNLVSKLADSSFSQTKEKIDRGFIITLKDGARYMELIFDLVPENSKTPEGYFSLGYSLSEIDSHLFKVKQDYENTADSVQKLVQKKISGIQYYGILLTLLILALATLVAMFLSSKIINPIKQLEKTMRKVESEHDLTQAVAIRSKDEVGSLAGTLNEMISKLKIIVSKVQAASLQVGSCSTELLAAAEEISKGAKNQAKHIEDTSSAVTELTVSIQQVAETARKASDTAQKGGGAVSEVEANMNRIKKTVSDTAEKIKELGQRSKEIGKIVSAITQISDQTSLLALNAAIEAARAGEHGRGFAVVADEVSKLAVKASNSAKEIDELISDIKEKTDQSVNSMGNALIEVESGTTTINTAGKNFLEIVDFVRETATAVQEQAKAFEEISGSMNEVLNIAKETVVATEEAVVQGNELRELAEKLDEIIKQFKISSD